MRVIFMYSREKPAKGSTLPGTLPGPLEAFKGSRSVFLTQRTNQHALPNSASLGILELRNEDVELPESDESLYWCKIFKLDDFHQKHHLVRMGEKLFHDDDGRRNHVRHETNLGFVPCSASGRGSTVRIFGHEHQLATRTLEAISCTAETGTDPEVPADPLQSCSGALEYVESGFGCVRPDQHCAAHVHTHKHFYKHHKNKYYEPVFDSSTSVLYLNHMLLYECQGLSDELENLSQTAGPAVLPAAVPPLQHRRRQLGTWIGFDWEPVQPCKPAVGVSQDMPKCQ
ncbi:dopamine beta hydroxylase [Culex quinquefasciatus]|uniref:Dopamine beta hydroxylase n=1 Tax=Culex quinquefasciatus TaxID=7176 RepID=B0XBE2_CULQU|nr:dopamine beta hydroxylase [Culex quinquefasciatus]|eukprot:XP_001866964.1 dopamine beta hydroxylase [Culex quinquefasciatus]